MTQVWSLLLDNDLILNSLLLSWVWRSEFCCLRRGEEVQLIGVLNLLWTLNLWFGWYYIIRERIECQIAVAFVLYIMEHLLHTMQRRVRLLAPNHSVLVLRRSSWVRWHLALSLWKCRTFGAYLTDGWDLKWVTFITWNIVFSMCIMSSALYYLPSVVPHRLHQAWASLTKLWLLPGGGRLTGGLFGLRFDSAI